MMPYLLGMFSCVHEPCGQPGPLSPEDEAKWEWAMNNPDYRMYAHLWNILTQKGQRQGMTFWTLIDPYDYPELLEKSEVDFQKVKIPFVCGSGAYAYTYKMHWQGAQHWFINAQNSPKKRLLFNGPAHMERPFHDMHDDIIRWYDHWLKGIDNGAEDDPPVKVWVMGENKWRTYGDWPVPETQWTKFYLDSWERLTTEESLPKDADPELQPRPRRLHPDAAQEDHEGGAPALHDRAPGRRPAGGRALLADHPRRPRPGRHQLDHRPLGRGPGRVGADAAGGRAFRARATCPSGN